MTLLPLTRYFNLYPPPRHFSHPIMMLIPFKVIILLYLVMAIVAVAVTWNKWLY